MYMLITQRNKNIAHTIPISLSILATIVLIYVLHISVAKVFFELCGFKQKFEEKKGSVTFVESQGDLFEDMKVYKRHLNKQPSSLKNAIARIVESDSGNYPLVSNHVHYLRLNEPEFSFTHAISILSVYRNHVPLKIYIHTSNSSLSGPFWKKIQETKGLRLILKLIPLNISSYMCGNDNMSHTFIYNFLKLKILERYGGIFLNKDMFIVKNLDRYLHHSMTLHWNRNENIVNDQIIISARNFSILSKWIKGYSIQALHSNETTLMPFQYIKYIVSRRTHVVLMETFRFTITSAMLYMIYNAYHYNWHDQHAIWLMEDLTNEKTRKQVAMYASQFQVNAMKTTRDYLGHKSTGLNDNSVSEEEESEECAFLKMIRDVYY